MLESAAGHAFKHRPQGPFPQKEASADTQDSDGKPLLRPLHDYTTYSTEVYAKEAARIIDSHASGQAKGEFYIYAGAKCCLPRLGRFETV